jgi:NPCBM/NEW2 domain
MQGEKDASSRTVHEWIRTIAAVVVAVAAVVGVGVVVKVVVIEPSSPKPIVPSSSKAKVHPGAPAYLESLPSSGDTPEPGYIESGGRAFRHSIFYDDVGSPATSSKCEMSVNCRFTSYELGGHYSTFTASFGITTKSANPAGLTPSAHWHVSIDGHSLGEGEVNANIAPQPISLELNDGHVLELAVTVNEPGIAETINVLWGNARVS